MNEKQLRVGLVLMAAGNASRFHSNKLMAEFQGKTLFTRALEVIPAEEFYRIVVVSQYEQLIAQARAAGFRTVLNEHPEAGQSHTIALGVGALQNADSILFMVGDQPLLRRESILNELVLHRANPDRIIAMAFDERRGNPCIFPREFFPDLLRLTGNDGGSKVIKAHENRLLLCYAQNERELMDVDTVEELKDLIR